MGFRYAIENCPECGGELRGECDLLPGTCHLQACPDGSWEYAGGTEIWWDGALNQAQYDATGAWDGRVRVDCEEGHTWLTIRTDESGTSTSHEDDAPPPADAPSQPATVAPVLLSDLVAALKDSQQYIAKVAADYGGENPSCASMSRFAYRRWRRNDALIATATSTTSAP